MHNPAAEACRVQTTGQRSRTVNNCNVHYTSDHNHLQAVLDSNEVALLRYLYLSKSFYFLLLLK